jgi:hypothetical protein
MLRPYFLVVDVCILFIIFGRRRIGFEIFPGKEVGTAKNEYIDLRFFKASSN